MTGSIYRSFWTSVFTDLNISNSLGLLLYIAKITVFISIAF
jgi:hypothetical protein